MYLDKDVVSTYTDRDNELRGNTPLIGRSIDVDFGFAQISWDTIGCHKKGASRIVPNALGHLVEVWLVTQTLAILSIIDSRSLRPRFAQVSGLPDGNVRVQRAVVRAWCSVVLSGKVVLPSSKEGIATIAIELPDASIKRTRHRIVVWRVEYSYVCE